MNAKFQRDRQVLLKMGVGVFFSFSSFRTKEKLSKIHSEGTFLTSPIRTICSQIVDVKSRFAQTII